MEEKNSSKKLSWPSMISDDFAKGSSIDNISKIDAIIALLIILFIFDYYF